MAEFWFGIAMGSLATLAGLFIYRLVMGASGHDYNPYEVE